jgi:hypothetical protein
MPIFAKKVLLRLILIVPFVLQKEEVSICGLESQLKNGRPLEVKV